MTLLNARGLSKAYGPDTLFHGLNFTIEPGEKVGLIGRNGSGKSTLFGILAEEVDADDGDIARKRGSSVAFLPQEPRFREGATPQSEVAEALAPLLAAIAAHDKASEEMASASGRALKSLLEAQSEHAAEIERLGGWAWQHRVDEVLDKLQVNREDYERPMAVLSGGQRRRVALARMLLEQPSLLLLDEPTNHLDAETIEWLEETLISYPGGVLLVTHDRYFLERVVTRILELDGDQIYSYPGSYSVFMERKLERLRMQELAEEKRQKMVERELAWLRRGPKARTSKAKSRIKSAEALINQDAFKEEGSIQLSFEADHRLGGVILEAAGLEKSYEEKRVLKGVSLRMRKGDRIGVVGPNGCGKTTLLRLLLKQERPDGGYIKLGKNTRVGYMSQARDGLDPDAIVLDSLGEAERVKVGKLSVGKRALLKEFLFSYADQKKKVASLSGGETCRLILAKLMCQNANLLILDEPTNDLDIPSLQVLEDAIQGFDGCVLVVTHDRYFMNRVCNVIFAYEAQDFERYDGDYDFYRKRRDAAIQAAREASAAARAAAAPKAPPKPKVRRLTYKERQELDQMEETLMAAEEAKEALEAELADPELYKNHGDRVPELQIQLSEANKEVERLYARWEELEALKEE